MSGRTPNRKKHQISFEEAKTVLTDEDALLKTTRTTPGTKNALFCWA